MRRFAAAFVNPLPAGACSGGPVSGGDGLGQVLDPGRRQGRVGPDLLVVADFLERHRPPDPGRFPGPGRQAEALPSYCGSSVQTVFASAAPVFQPTELPDP